MSDVRNDGFGWEEPLDRRTLLGRRPSLAGRSPRAGFWPSRRPLVGGRGTVTAFFGQFGAIAEQEGIRSTCSKGFNGDVEAVFAPHRTDTFVDRSERRRRPAGAASTCSWGCTGTSSRSRTRG